MGNACANVSSSYFAVLPPELNLHILSFLDARDLINAAAVNREWHRLASDEFLWKSLFDRRWKYQESNTKRHTHELFPILEEASEASSEDDSGNGRVSFNPPVYTYFHLLIACINRRKSDTDEAGGIVLNIGHEWTKIGALETILVC